AAAAAAGCAGGAAGGGGSGPAVVQPGAPGQEARRLDPEEVAALAAAPPATAADVRFMRGMVSHHLQALEMTRLASERAVSEAVRMMALRMEISQRDEVERIRRWLAAHAAEEAAEETHAHAGDVPGMLTPEEMERLASASGSAFDRLFLESMIRHHEGAITMVERLFGSSGSGQGAEIFRVASEIESDQRMEIARMRSLLEEGEKR
ncbi:MAG TPA: DUF305 domain-containing protein, partial [Longimicrobiales bacterium]|nr:DUF305 domain-containing protein [Longimicrobiales bacterium]